MYEQLYFSLIASTKKHICIYGENTFPASTSMRTKYCLLLWMSRLTLIFSFTFGDDGKKTTLYYNFITKGRFVSPLKSYQTRDVSVHPLMYSHNGSNLLEMSLNKNISSVCSMSSVNKKNVIIFTHFSICLW